MKFFLLCGAMLVTVLCSGQQKDLSFYLSMAKGHTPVLADLAGQRRSLSLDSARLRATYGLQVSADVNLLYAPVIHGWGYDNAITNGQNMTGVLSLRKEITSRDNLETRLRQFSIQGKQADNQQMLSSEIIQGAVTQQYIICYGDQQQYFLAREISAFLEVEDEILKALTRTASFSQSDYLLFKVALQTQDLAQQEARSQFLTDMGQLNYACGLVDTSWVDLPAPDWRDSVALPTGYDQSVYYDQNILDSAQIDNAAQITRLNYKPRISVFGDGGYSSSLPRQAGKNFGASIGLSYSLPIYDGKQKKYALLQNSLADESRIRHATQRQRQYEGMVLQLKQQLDLAGKQIAAAEKRLVYAKTLITAGKKLLPAGDMRMADYLMGINNYMNLSATVIQNKVKRLLVIYQLQHIILP